MDVYVVDPKMDFQQVAVIDTFKSLIWTTRYYSCGDFELYMPADKSLLDVLHPDCFLVRDDDDSVMVIEKMKIQTDMENGDYFIISGRSLESILYRRIFQRQFTLNNSGTLAEAVQAMVTECTTNHDTWHHPLTFRQIPNLAVDLSSNFDGAMQVQFTGDTLLDGIFAVCKAREVGVKMILDGTTMLLTLYKGEAIETTFSPEFDNLVNSTYLIDITNFANSVTVAGEGEGNQRQIITSLSFPFDYPDSGLDLHEMFCDARNISSNGGEIDRYDYLNLLSEKASDFMASHNVLRSFESEVEPQASFKFKTDWNLGDTVTVTNEYDVTAYPRIVEVIECWDDTGYKVIPTFDSLDITDNRIVLRDSECNILRDSNGKFLCVRE